MKSKESIASGSTKRRDFLTAIEASVQQSWSEAEVYRSEPDPSRPKFFVTFPYPYMNGLLHLGHAFSASKCEFAARFQRLMGENTLLPFGFHCSGMPIRACADKLRKELADNQPGRQTFALKEMGIEDADLPKFVDPAYWLSYFPPQAIADLKSLGVATDWRRSFHHYRRKPVLRQFRAVAI
jgi:leucyl-tRNA synthetase